MKVKTQKPNFVSKAAQVVANETKVKLNTCEALRPGNLYFFLPLVSLVSDHRNWQRNSCCEERKKVWEGNDNESAGKHSKAKESFMSQSLSI